MQLILETSDHTVVTSVDLTQLVALTQTTFGVSLGDLLPKASSYPNFDPSGVQLALDGLKQQAQALANNTPISSLRPPEHLITTKKLEEITPEEIMGMAWREDTTANGEAVVKFSSYAPAALPGMGEEDAERANTARLFLANLPPFEAFLAQAKTTPGLTLGNPSYQPDPGQEQPAPSMPDAQPSENMPA